MPVGRRHRVLLSVCLGLAGALCAFVACTKQTPSQSPTATTNVRDDGQQGGLDRSSPFDRPSGQRQDGPGGRGRQQPVSVYANVPHAWIYASPFRTQMRLLWVRCGIIVSNCSETSRGNYHLVRDAVDGIKRTSAMYLERFEEVLHACDELTAASERSGPNWFQETNGKFEELVNACWNCHQENWAPAVHGVTPMSVDRWRTGRYAPPIDGGTSPESIGGHFTASMQDMRASTMAMIDAIKANWADGVTYHSLHIRSVLEQHIEWWRGMEQRADVLLEAIKQADTRVIHDAYVKMSMQCMGCHARYVDATRSTGKEIYFQPPIWPDVVPPPRLHVPGDEDQGLRAR